MATTGQRYAVDIGTGAAGGAAAGTAIVPGWGTAIGAGIGAIGGAVSAAFGNAEEARAKKRLEEQQQRARGDVLIDLERAYAQKHGIDTTYLDVMRAEKGLDRQELAQNANFAASQRIDPQSFAPMAANLTKAAGGIYKAANAPSSPYGMPGDDFNRPPTQDASGAYTGADVGQMLPIDRPNDVGGSFYDPNKDQQDWLRGLA